MRKRIAACSKIQKRADTLIAMSVINKEKILVAK